MRRKTHRLPVRTNMLSQQMGCERLRDTWLTDLLARASRGGNNDQTDFTPKRALRHTTRIGIRRDGRESQTV
jgi:hypothetical protein